MVLRRIDDFGARLKSKSEQNWGQGEDHYAKIPRAFGLAAPWRARYGGEILPDARQRANRST
jgi:hypothetical protein